ncbi:MAG: mechanosensitive ion channel [Bacteroides sp.]|nr:mechanosensitive ion channel [Bacteroides sp.]
MNDFLVEVLGISKDVADVFDESLIALLMIALVTGLNYICQALLVRIVRRVEKRRWSRLLIKRKVLHHLLHILPGIFLFLLLPLAFVEAPKLLAFAQRICIIYIIYSVLLTLNGGLLIILDVYNSKDELRSHPIKGVIQIFQVLLFFIGGIIIVAILIDKSPATLFAGLGASAAVLMLIFKDSILGFVAGVQLSANDMVRLGDWIQLPKENANGLVEEITLNTVKIRNWDNTISTVPPYTLANTTFINWRGMKEGGGRRVLKNIKLDVNTLTFCTPDLLASLRSRIPLMRDYEPREGEVPTNAQLYRIYIGRYLSTHPEVNQDMDLIVTQKEATEYGVPIQVYFFLRNKVWKEYERIQSDIFDHLLVMVKDFGLKLYQYSE